MTELLRWEQPQQKPQPQQPQQPEQPEQPASEQMRVNGFEGLGFKGLGFKVTAVKGLGLQDSKSMMQVRCTTYLCARHSWILLYGMLPMSCYATASV